MTGNKMGKNSFLIEINTKNSSVHSRWQENYRITSAEQCVTLYIACLHTHKKSFSWFFSFVIQTQNTHIKKWFASTKVGIVILPKGLTFTGTEKNKIVLDKSQNLYYFKFFVCLCAQTHYKSD